MSLPILRVGSRDSALARTQTEGLVARLDGATTLVWIASDADRDPTRPLAAWGGAGAFTSALSAALRADRCDAAVHSLKDLPVAPDPGTALAAVPAREDPRDAWVSRDGTPFRALRRGATVATGSPRRLAELRRLRPDLVVVGLRGNVDTRLRRLREGAFDGIVLAVAGLVRLGLASAITHPFEPDEMLPAPGQGALAVTIREGDVASRARVAVLADPRTTAEVSAERAALHGLGAGCHAPVGALARADGDRLALRTRLLAPDGSDSLEVRVDGALADADALGLRAADDLLRRGGGRWIARS